MTCAANVDVCEYWKCELEQKRTLGFLTRDDKMRPPTRRYILHPLHSLLTPPIVSRAITQM